MWVAGDGAEQVELDEGARSRPSNGSSVVSSPSSGVVRGASLERASGGIGGKGAIELDKGVCNGADSPSDFGGELSSVEEELAARLAGGRAVGDGDGWVRFLRDDESGDARERNRSAMLALTVRRDHKATELNQLSRDHPAATSSSPKEKTPSNVTSLDIVRSRIVQKSEQDLSSHWHIYIDLASYRWTRNRQRPAHATRKDGHRRVSPSIASTSSVDRTKRIADLYKRGKKGMVSVDMPGR